MANTLYLPLSNAISDTTNIKPLPQVEIKTPFQTGPVNWGPRWNNITPRNGLYLETLNPPTYGPLIYQLADSPRITPPINYTFETIQNRSTGDIAKKCPTAPIPLRNTWETYNTNSGKYYGGYTKYSIKDIPSCSDMNDSYMNFMAFATQPWARAYVEQRPEVLAVDSHEGAWADTIPRWVDARLHGHHVNVPSRSSWPSGETR